MIEYMHKMNDSKIQINCKNLILTDNVRDDLKLDLPLRSGFEISPQMVTVPAYFYRFIGIKENNEEYFDDILKIDKELKFLGSLYLKITKGFSRDVSIKIQSIMQNFKPYEDDIFILLQKVKENSLFISEINLNLMGKINNNLKVVLDYYTKIKCGRSNVIEILGFMIHWINIYIPSLFVNYDFDGKNPKVLYYGGLTEEEGLFLFLLWTLGVDVIYYNTENDNVFKVIDPQNNFSKVINFSEKCSLKDLPETFKQRINTTAFGAKEELDKILYNEDTNFYRPWQFTEYLVKNVTLKTTFEEIKIWVKEKGNIREGWRVKDKTVYIPNIFSKIRGVTENVEEYFGYIKDIKALPNVTFINKLPMVSFVTLEYKKFNEIYPVNSNNFNIDKMINSNWWPYSELRTGLQRALAENIKELCLNPIIYNKQNEVLRDLQVEIFSVLINGINTTFTEVLQSFDYPCDVPKIIIYNNEHNGKLSLEDCIILTLMNYMGVDIIIFNPSGYNDIENIIYRELYDVHTLDKMSFNLKLREPKEKKGILRSIFGI